MRREERFSELSRAVAHDVEQRVCETSWEVLLVGVRPAFDAQADLGASRALGFDAVNVSYPGGEGPEDLAMNLVVRLLDPADTTVRVEGETGEAEYGTGLCAPQKGAGARFPRSQEIEAIQNYGPHRESVAEEGACQSHH